MKNLLLIFLVLLSTSLSSVEYGTITDNSVLELNDGDIFTFLGSGGNSYLYIYDTDVDKLMLTNDFYNYQINGYTADNSGFPHYLGFFETENSFKNIIVGPCVLFTDYQVPYITYSIMRKNEYQNSNVFTVLGDSSTTHNIVVETSTDLENWTPVHSSGLTGSSEQIYVRTRISTSE